MSCAERALAPVTNVQRTDQSERRRPGGRSGEDVGEGCRECLGPGCDMSGGPSIVRSLQGPVTCQTPGASTGGAEERAGETCRRETREFAEVQSAALIGKKGKVHISLLQHLRNVQS